MKTNEAVKANVSKKCIPAIVFYVLAVIFIVYGAYMIFSVYEYLVEYYANYGTTMAAEMTNTIQYFISNCSPYFVYAVLCYGIGTIMQMIHSLKVTTVQDDMDAIVEEVNIVEVEENGEDTTIV